MLNPKLFDALQDIVDPDVRVVNEDAPGSFSVPAVKGMFRKSKRKVFVSVEDWGEVYAMNCPVCGDTRHRLYMSHLWNLSTTSKGRKTRVYFGRTLYRCHNESCDLRAAGIVDKLVKAVGDQKLDESVRPSQKAHLSFMHEIVLPSSVVPIVSEDVPDSMLSYLYGRSFTPSLLYRDYKVHYAPKGATVCDTKMNDDRLLVPLILGGKIRSWQARLPLTDILKTDRKYINASNDEGVKKSKLLYNADNAKCWTSIAVVEGVTDVWRIGMNSVALFGKSMSDHQAELFRVLWSGQPCRVLVWMDPKAETDAEKIAKELHNKGGFANVVIVDAKDDKDPAEHSEDEIDDILREHGGYRVSSEAHNAVFSG